MILFQDDISYASIYCDDLPLVDIIKPEPTDIGILIRQPSPELLAIVPSQPVLSSILDISLAPGSNVDELTICLPMTKDTDKDKACLGFIDEAERPPIWKCQDRCLKQNDNGLLCGKTDHFTNFAILLAGNGAGGCDDDGAYITGSLTGDLILVSCFAGSCILFCLFIALFTSIFPSCGKLFYGKEGHRIRTLRKQVDTDEAPRDTSSEVL